MDNLETGKVDAKGRKVFKDSKGRTHVKQGDKKVYVKKLFTPKRSSPSMANTRTSSPAIRATSPVINTGKVNAKKRQVFKDSKGRTYVKQDGKKVYVKKLYTPFTPPSPKRSISPRASSPGDENTGKVNENQHPVFRNSKGRTYAMHGDKKVYVTKLFTPFTPPSSKRSISPSPQPFKGRGNILSQIKLDCSTPAGLGQASGTCWFNASLNGFILGEATAKMILNQIKQLSSSEIDALMKDFPSDSCPIALSRKYVYSYFLKIHSGTQITGKKGNAAVDLIGKLFTPKRLSSPVADGRNGGRPAVAALKILSKVFPDGTTGRLRRNEKTCPNDFSKYTMVYRSGPANNKTLAPDTQPLVIKTKDGKTKFKLSHMVYAVRMGELGSHAVVAYVCGGQEYAYDSNTRRRLKDDWSNPETREELLRYSGADRFETVEYCLYVRE